MGCSRHTTPILNDNIYSTFYMITALFVKNIGMVIKYNFTIHNK